MSKPVKQIDAQAVVNNTKITQEQLKEHIRLINVHRQALYQSYKVLKSEGFQLVSEQGWNDDLNFETLPRKIKARKTLVEEITE